jgi:hypothetical protein
MKPTKLQLVDRSTKWGLVTVHDPQWNVVSEHMIDAAEADAVASSARGWPSCVSRELWETGLVQSAAYTVLPGQASQGDDGTLLVGLTLDLRPPYVHARILRLQPHEWAESDGVVSVDGPAVLTIQKAGW